MICKGGIFFYLFYFFSDMIGESDVVIGRDLKTHLRGTSRPVEISQLPNRKSQCGFVSKTLAAKTIILFHEDLSFDQCCFFFFASSSPGLSQNAILCLVYPE